jgi:photosystem II stability/assembly factor-like uncharacterized protein
LKEKGKRQKVKGRAPYVARFVSCRLLLTFCLLPFSFCLATRAEGVWSRQRSGTLAWLHAVHFVDERRGWAAGSKGALLATEDGGATWQLRRRPSDDTLRDIHFADPDNGWIVCERNVYAIQSTGEARSYLLKTSDGGRTWARVELQEKGQGATMLRVVFASRERGWAFGETGVVYATSDGGRTWARQRVPSERLLLGGTFLDERTGWLVGAGATFLYTQDGGETWGAGALLTDAQAAPRRGARLYAASFVDARRGWAVGARGAVYATTNGGRTWRALPAATDADLYDVKFLDEREGWAAGAAGTLLHTRDGGRTWRAAAAGMTTHPLERLFFSGRARGWAVGFGGTIISYARDARAANTAAR